MNEPKAVNAQLRRVLTDSSRQITAAHRFFYTRVGSEIVLDVGHFDLPELRSVIEKAKAANSDEAGEVNFFITHRLSLSVDAAVQLADVAKQMVDSLRETGAIGGDEGDEGGDKNAH